MIIATPIPRVIGKTYIADDISDSRGVIHHGVPVFVVAEATREDWVAHARDEGVDEALIQSTLGIMPEDILFYRVSVD